MPEDSESPADEKQIRAQNALPASIQLEAAFPIEIVARRYPVVVQQGEVAVSTSLSLDEIQIDTENHRAQAVFGVQITFPEDVKPFDISFKIIGIFVCDPQHSQEELYSILQLSSVGVLLPFARQLLMDLCSRLQVPIIVLPMIRVEPVWPVEIENTHTIE